MLKKAEKRGKIVFARWISVFLRTGRIAPHQLEDEDIESILLIRQHNQMGDMLAAVPAFRGIRKRFPAARITLVAAPINSEVMEGNPYVDEVTTYSKEKHRRNPLRIAAFIRSLRRRKFDLVIVLNTVSFSVTSMLLAVVSGARIRTGSSSASFGSDLTSRYYHIELPLPSQEELKGMNEALHNLYPLAALGISESDLRSVIVPSKRDEEDCRGIIEILTGGRRRFALVHPGAGKKQNIWPPERFAEAASILSYRYGLSIAAVRGPAERESFDRFLSRAAGIEAVLSSPRIGLLAALMREAAVTLCNDTGVMHIAGAAGARCVAVFGPTDPVRWKPVNESVKAVVPPGGDILAVPVEDVTAAAAELIEGIREE